MFKYSSRFWLYAPITLFLTLAIAVMIHWWLAAGAFEKRLAALKGHEAIPGVTLDWATVVVGGFPFRLDADFTGFSARGDAAQGPFLWQTEKFALHTLTYNRSKTVYEAAGRQAAQWVQANGRFHVVSFFPGSMRGSSIVDRAGLQRFDLDIVNLGDKAFTISRFQFHMRRDPDGRKLDAMLKADAMQARGSSSQNLQIYASLNRLDSLMPLLRGKNAWPRAMREWVAQGGSATFTQVNMPPGESPELLLSPLYFYPAAY